MKIGIIGSGIAGLAAGRLLAKAGHEVTIIERDNHFGGRLVSTNSYSESDTCVDTGIPFFTAETSGFSAFIAELISEGLVKIWGDSFSFYDGSDLLPDNPNRQKETRYASVKGMSSISRYLGRHCDFLLGDKAGGVTNIGAGRDNKKPWMINLTSFKTFEADAVIIATPAPEAYGIILTSQDETEIFKIIREIDVVGYDSLYTLAAVYKDLEVPSWDGIVCRDDVISFISNENRKRDNKKAPILAIHSTPGFAQEHRTASPDEVKEIMLDRLQKITGKWGGSPVWTELNFWRYYRPKQILDAPFYHIGGNVTPLGLVGDYFEAGTVEGAYNSGVSLAKSWIAMFKGESLQEEVTAVPSTLESP